MLIRITIIVTGILCGITAVVTGYSLRGSLIVEYQLWTLMKGYDEERVLSEENIKNLKSERAVSCIINLIRQRPSKKRLYIYIKALSDIGEKAVPKIIEAMKEGGFTSNGVLCILRMKERDALVALPFFIENASSSQYMHRVFAIEVLGSLGFLRAVPTLLVCLLDSDESVRAASKESLYRIFSYGILGAHIQKIVGTALRIIRVLREPQYSH